MKAIISALCLTLPYCYLFSQENSPLNAFSKEDALYTTYAAARSRSDYKSDQAYELMWTDPSKTIGLQSRTGGECGILFALGNRTIRSLSDFFSEPLVTYSGSDLVKLHFEPIQFLHVDATFCVYSSHVAILEYMLTNTSGNAMSVSVFPYYKRDQGIEDPEQIHPSMAGFRYEQALDPWMKEHKIPVADQFSNLFIISQKPAHVGISNALPMPDEMLAGKLKNKPDGTAYKVLCYQNDLIMESGQQSAFRVLLFSNQPGTLADQEKDAKKYLQLDLEQLIEEGKKGYQPIPEILSMKKLSATSRKDRTGLYTSAFNLMKQCMMPAEGECLTNYYVYSREPKWGWGYGGQVFHESLAMLAYVHLDPEGAMNSQRVFIQRQQKDGYINYRTGPYLNETIIRNSMRTSASPWFSYINYEIYKVSLDKKFLAEAYESGKKLYNWFVRNRDRDGDGLFEWGGDATLECVRDGRVATWDRVSKPENLEGPDLNSLMVKEALSLSEMAKVLGKEKEESLWIRLATNHASRINNQLWDSSTGFYYNTLLSTNGFTFLQSNDLKIKEMTGFLPLWANLCSPEQAKLLVQSLYNPEEFWRPYGIPSLSANDPYYNPMGYWNGPVWVQWQYLIFRGLIDYGYKQVALQLGEKVMNQMIWHLKNDHTFWEFYSPDDRQAGWNKSYIWAGIVARMMMDMEALR